MNGLRVADAPGTPLLVNMGTTRPAITDTMNRTTSNPSFKPAQAGRPMTPSCARWTNPAATAISSSSATKK